MAARCHVVFCVLISLILLEESTRTASANDLASSKPPNILIAMADDMSWPHTSAAGCRAVHTPNIDRVAKMGVTFRNGYCGAPGCSPSRAVLLTGRHVWMNAEASTHHGLFPKHLVAFPELLARSGYLTGFTGKPWSPGDVAPGRQGNPVGPAFNQHHLTPPLNGIKDNDYAANFADFLSKRQPNQPFCFWYGSVEPHRGYQKGSGIASGKKLADAPLPAFLPDTPETRSDFLDYLTEIEWFDENLGKMLQQLEDINELNNTLIIVTGDDGMAMLRAKATCYEYGLHVPLYVAWPNQIPANRSIDDPVGFVDLHATIVAAAGCQSLLPTEESTRPVGRDLLPMLLSDKSGLIDREHAEVFAGHERHTLTRYNDEGYPIRALRTPQYLYLRNLRPERWPVGDPQRINPQTGKLLPRHAGCYRDIDDQETLVWLIKAAETSTKYSQLLELIVGRHPAEELYDIQRDPDCMQNLVKDPAHQASLERLAARMDLELKQTADPRVHGPDPDRADKYINVNPKNKMGEGLYPAPSKSP